MQKRWIERALAQYTRTQRHTEKHAESSLLVWSYVRQWVYVGVQTTQTTTTAAMTNVTLLIQHCISFILCQRTRENVCMDKMRRVLQVLIATIHKTRTIYEKRVGVGAMAMWNNYMINACEGCFQCIWLDDISYTSISHRMLLFRIRDYLLVCYP